MCVDADLKKSKERLKTAQENLEKASASPDLLVLAAQEMNDAWLEFKKADVAAANYSTFKKLRDLYGV